MPVFYKRPKPGLYSRGINMAYRALKQAGKSVQPVLNYAKKHYRPSGAARAGTRPFKKFNKAGKKFISRVQTSIGLRMLKNRK